MLDQFPRSLWRDTPSAFAQDNKATRLALEGIENGDFAGLETWEQAFFVIAIQHCEGPEHQQRLEWLTSIVHDIADGLKGPLEGMASVIIEQHERIQGIIAKFGRHPHRNPIYGRISSPEEEAYIATGDFPHVRKDLIPNGN